MTRRPPLALFVLVAGGLSLFAVGHSSCRADEPGAGQAIVGTWSWFFGGPVTIKPNHTMAFQNRANDGTWACVDSSRRLFILKWRVGGFVNRVILSADGKNLGSADPTQPYVHATRVAEPPAAVVERGSGSSAAGGADHTKAPPESFLASLLRGVTGRGRAGGGEQTAGWDRNAVYRARVARLKRAIAAHPNDPDVLVALASFYLKPLAPRMVEAADGKVRRVMVPLRNEIRRPIKDIDAVPWVFRGDPNAAYPLLKRALQLNPRDAGAIRDMAMLYRMKHDLDRMQPYVSAALKNNPMDLDMCRLYLDYETALAHNLDIEAGVVGAPHQSVRYENRSGGRYRVTTTTNPGAADLARARQLFAQAREARHAAIQPLENFARTLANDPRTNSDPRMAAEWRLATAIADDWLGRGDRALGTGIAALRYDPTYLDALDFVVDLLRLSHPTRNVRQYQALLNRYTAILNRWNGGNSTPRVFDDQKRTGPRH